MAPSQGHPGDGFSDHRITRSKGSPGPRGYPPGASQIGVDLSDGHPRVSQIGVGFTHMGTVWRVVAQVFGFV